MTGNCEIFDPECFEYHEGFLGRREADDCLRVLWQDLEWTRQEITLFGRRVVQPRLIAWYGDASAEYSYSGLSLSPKPWHHVLLDLKTRLEIVTRRTFNSVLANAYRDGSDSMGWHQDNEKELGRQPLIASLSLGCGRRFLVRPSARAGIRPGPSTGMNLEHGSLLVMKGECQDKYQHSLPKTKQKIGLRINLTYREILV